MQYCVWDYFVEAEWMCDIIDVNKLEKLYPSIKSKRRNQYAILYANKGLQRNRLCKKT